MNIQKLSDCIIIDEKYILYSDGVIYNLTTGGDIPQWLFELKDFILKNHSTMML